MTTDETDNGWDSLADDLGIASPEPAPAPKAEKPAASTGRTGRRPAAGHRDPRPEIEQEAEDFASGLTAEPAGALYDPGPETVVDHAADLEETVDPADEGLEGDEPAGHEEGEPGEGGKRRRRRRRRKRKGGAPEGAAGEGEAAGEEADEEAATVEEGEAPAPLDEDDDEEAAPSAVDEEMEAEAAQPRPEWHVMSWNELVSRLHRPG